MRCHHCGFEIKIDGKVSRQAVCPECSAYLHCCLNCRFYAPDAYHQCRETQAEWVNDKAGANFCDYFEPAASDRSQKQSKAEEARKKLDQLFKKG